MMKSWLGFGDHDLFFKVTAGLKLPNLSQKVVVCTVSHEPVGGFLTRFSWILHLDMRKS